MAVASGDGFAERAMRFGPGRRLFGILAGPDNESSPAASIILLNTGAGHHVGPHRLYVPLARELAARGHLVLRFDLGGIGDSAPTGGSEHNPAYPAHMLHDAFEAIALMRRRAPETQVILAGLCSGGWLAFEAARHGLAVDAIVSINPPLYLRDAGMRWLSEWRQLERYRRSMRDPSRWLEAIRGRVSYATFIRTVASASARRAAVKISGALGGRCGDGLAKDLFAIAHRGIQALFVFSPGDQGFAYFQQHAQPAIRRSRVCDAVQHVVVEGADHAFSTRAAQKALRTILLDFPAAHTLRLLQGAGDRDLPPHARVTKESHL